MKNLSAPPSDLLRSLVPPEAVPRAADPLLFPWPEIRDFISTMVSGMMAQQNLMVGEAILASGAPNASAEQVETVRELTRKLDVQLLNLNGAVEQKLAEFEGKRPRIILPR